MTAALFSGFRARFTSHLPRPSWLLIALCLAWSLPVGLLGGPSVVRAQDGDEDEEEEKIPEPESIVRQTKDGVRLAMTYYASTEGRDAVPVVCLHALEGSQNRYTELALGLQQIGYAVLTVDLRGHGDSTQVVGMRRELDASRLSPDQIKAMVGSDMVTVTDFLWEKNNEEELNMNRLCIIGAEAGAVVATNYAAFDWSIRDYGALQQGHFVKGLVLLSPPVRTKGLNIMQALQHPALLNAVAVMITFGKRDATAVRDAEQIYKRLTGSGKQPEDPRERRVFAFGLNTQLQGAKPLGQRVKLEQYIAGFLKLKLREATGPEYEWKELRKPHQ